MQYLLLKWYQENKKTIWIIVIVVISIVLVVNILDRFYKDDNYKENNNIVNNNIKSEINNEITGTLESTESLISSENVSKEKLKTDSKLINDFFDYCNDGKIEEAYNLLTDECKEVKYNSLENFTKLYYKPIFDTNKSFSMQNWEKNTYLITIKEDALATGKIASNIGNIQDYITVVDNGENKKLNIGGYIGRKTFDKKDDFDEVEITLMYKDVYMDYEIYNLKVKNNTNSTIQFDDGTKVDSIYLEDENKVHENVLTGEVLYSDMKIEKGQTKRYTFKFANSYTTSRRIDGIVFNNIVLNYDEYMANNTIEKRLKKIYVGM